MHLGHPVAQRVHDQLQRMRVADVEAVAGPGVVHVVALVVVDQPVVRGVVDAAHGQRRAQVVALCGVVVDDVEDHLDVGLVQGAHHRLELLDLSAGVGAGAVLRVRRQKADGVVAPVVRQPLVDQRGVVGEVMHGHQFDCVDAQRFQVIDDHRMGDGGVRTADLFGNVRVRLGQPLDVRLVDHRVGVFVAGRAIDPPVEERVDDDGLGRAGRGVVVVAAVGIAEVVAEQRLIPLERAVDGLGVRVQQQLVGVAPVTRGRVVRPVHAVAVALAGFDGRDETVPDETVHLRQGDAGGLGSVGVEQTQLDLLGDLAEHREVRARPVVGGSERVGLSWPDFQLDSLRGGGLGQSWTLQTRDSGRDQGDDTGMPKERAVQPTGPKGRLPDVTAGQRRRCGNHHPAPAEAAQRRRRRDARGTRGRLSDLRPRRRRPRHRADGRTAGVLRGRRSRRG